MKTLDVRTIDGPPFSAIDRELGALASDDEPDDELRLIADFEPVPLYEVLEQRGFEHDAEKQNDDEWHVLIRERSGDQ